MSVSRFQYYFIGFALSAALLVCALGCSEKPKSRIIFRPQLDVDFGSQIYIDGRLVGRVENLEMDANHCYAVVEFDVKEDRDLANSWVIDQESSGKFVLRQPTEGEIVNGYQW
jgi:hypothetical protein